MTLGHLAARMQTPGGSGFVRIAIKGTVIDALGLKKHHRILALDRADQEALGVIGVRGHDHLDPAHVREQCLGALRMGLAAADAAAAGRADRDRGGEVPRGAIAQPRQLAHDLIEPRIDVVGELDFRHGLEAVGSHTDGRADDAAFGNRRIQHALIAVLALQAFGGAEHPAEEADVLAEDDHARVAFQHNVHRGVQRLDHVHACHGGQPFCATGGVAARAAACALLRARNSSRSRARLAGISLKTSSNMVSGSRKGPAVSVP